MTPTRPTPRRMCPGLNVAIRRPMASTAAGSRTAASVAKAGPRGLNRQRSGVTGAPRPAGARDDNDARDPGGEDARHAGEPDPLVRAVPSPGGDEDRRGRRDRELPDAHRKKAGRERGDEGHPSASPWSHLVPSSRHSMASAKAGTSVMKLADSRANPGKATTSRTDHDRRARPDEAPGQEIAGRDADQRHDQPERGERPRIAPGQPQQRLHHHDLPDGCGRVPRHVDAARAEQALGAPHVDPVVVAGNADRAGCGRQPEGNADGDRGRGLPRRARPGGRCVQACLRPYRNPDRR